ncbi:prolipoprotein diacylglyceryl transferase [Dethiosulfatarculus sandiegensis]|uniref:Phosphatidylglycerol--prolipoprotein diacylglyceryl transferase n=1 Tax=Dethiosulfatarculus sandiegensis TaxID=1429043 RepID=A0A0D2GH39_9BACT|nr:prolipoprotein diacylglyceryl transferase [Dethiosulfatarculus sandiegensis]KIX14242.1 prolipoprotein diacylglyceryl transferase [Dethiosulfatarculus sandiegensis]
MTYPQIDPVLISFGPIAVRWYGLMYVLGFLGGYLVISNRLKKTLPRAPGDLTQELLLWCGIGLLLGGRLGYVLFYQWMNLDWYLKNPIEIIAIWHGGMSFHGGLVGAALAGFTLLKKRKTPLLPAADAACLAAPIGLGLGRIGNFINGELYGRITELPWGMVFPGAGPLPRHPSQLYEMVLEGPVLFFLLWMLKDRVKPGQVSVLFIIGYSLARFLVEFVRQPDPQLGLVISFLTMGQILSLAQAALGVIFWYITSRLD